MWEHRNGILHGPNGTLEKRQNLQLNEHIRKEISKGKQGLYKSDLQLFDRLLKELLQLSTSDKQKWLDSVYWTRESYVAPEQRARRQLRQQQASMANWLGRSENIDRENVRET